MAKSVNRSSSRRNLLLSAPAALLVLGIATGCGAGGNHSSAVRAAAAVPDSTTALNPTASSAVSPVKASGGGSFCKIMADSNAVAHGNLGDMSPAAIKQEYDHALALTQQATDNAPSEIKTDMQNLLDDGRKFRELLAAHNYDFSKLGSQASADLTSPQFQAASAHVVAYLKDHCGIDPGNAAGGSSSTLTTVGQ